MVKTAFLTFFFALSFQFFISQVFNLKDVKPPCPLRKREKKPFLLSFMMFGSVVSCPALSQILLTSLENHSCMNRHTGAECSAAVIVPDPDPAAWADKFLFFLEFFFLCSLAVHADPFFLYTNKYNAMQSQSHCAV